MNWRLRIVSTGLFGLGIATGCFSPNPALESEATSDDESDASTGGASTMSTTADSTSSGTTAGTMTTVGESTTENPPTTNPTTTTDPDTGSDSSSTGEPIEPGCDNGVVEQGELCFGEPVAVEFSDEPLAVEFGEVDGDDAIDIVCALTDDVEFVLGDGGGSFEDVVSAAPGLAIAVADFYDIDDDGLVDISYVNEATQVRVARSNGTGFSGGASSFALETAGQLVLGGSIRGMNYDVVAISNGDRAFVLAGGDEGVESQTEIVSYAPQTAPSDGALGDLSGDGRDDLVLALPGATPTVLRYQGMPNGGLSEPPHEVLDSMGVAGTGLGSIAIGDFDDDGDLDLAMAAEAFVIVGFNDGLGVFESPTLVATPTPARDVHAADLDGDGSDELIATFGDSPGPGSLVVYSVDDSGSSDDLELDIPFVGRFMDAADANGDGVLDLLVASGVDGSVLVFPSSP